MILLSRIIKFYQAKEQTEKEISIKIRPFPMLDLHDEEQDQDIDDSLIYERMEHAKREAETIIREAKEQAEVILGEVQQARNQWELDEKPMYIEQAQKEGYQQGM